MTTTLAEKYNLSVPRYTSYPTAPHFSAAIDGQRYRQWLSTLDVETPLSLYVHIPFCDSMCWFCGCYTKVVQRYEPISEYLRVMAGEVELIAAALPGHFMVRHLHWGGGSPTMLTPADWNAQISLIGRHFAFTGDAELAVEIDPRDATEDYIAALAASGVNRASIGVQDFDSRVQEAINRQQPFEVVELVCHWLRKYGIVRINLDLMYGLPYQTEVGVIDMVDRALSLEPSRVALFGYAHVPWMKSHQKMIDEATLPDGRARWIQFAAATERLQDAGYLAVGLDHFARRDDDLAAALSQGRLRRNFQGYTTDEADVLIGLGASAIGSMPQGYVQNVSPLRDYQSAIRSGTLPTTRGIELTAEDRLRRRIIERLMCELAVDLDVIGSSTKDELIDFDRELTDLKPFVDDGLLSIQDRLLKITDVGRPFVRLIAATFDTYLRENKARHSRAV